MFLRYIGDYFNLVLHSFIDTSKPLFVIELLFTLKFIKENQLILNMNNILKSLECCIYSSSRIRYLTSEISNKESFIST